MIAPALFASIAIILLSFVSEDAATISSSLSVFGGPVPWPVGFASCFIGIWLGDIGLYALARCGGRRVVQSRWLARYVDSDKLSSCETAFARKGSAALIVSRFVPGTRLPTYLAAGLFRMSLSRFATVTGICALVWVSGIFVLSTSLGAQAVRAFASRQSILGRFVVAAVFLVLFIVLIRKAAILPRFVSRVRQWEFWPAWAFYAPVALYYAALSIRYRSFTLPSAANPRMPNGGFIGESKFEILTQLQEADPELIADAYLLDGRTTTDRLLRLHAVMRDHAITLPFVLKPDVGQRGDGVRIVRTLREALEYLLKVNGPVVLQRYVTGPEEAGVFYYRMPGEVHGQIFSITDKRFPVVVGDGMSTLEQLIRADSRASVIAHTYLRRFARIKDEIIPEGERFKLVEAGNHAQGCIFQNGGHLWTKELERAIDQLARKIPEFYFGRFDVRYSSELEFRAGRGFKIVELNGTSSEATSIYDARNSLISAYRTLFRQWKLAFEIGATNRRRGCAPWSLRTLWRAWRDYSAVAMSYPCAS